MFRICIVRPHITQNPLNIWLNSSWCARACVCMCSCYVCVSVFLLLLLVCHKIHSTEQYNDFDKWYNLQLLEWDRATWYLLIHLFWYKVHKNATHRCDNAAATLFQPMQCYWWYNCICVRFLFVLMLSCGCVYSWLDTNTWIFEHIPRAQTSTMIAAMQIVYSSILRMSLLAF